ncbi:hypothetical protein WICMUC_002757 [Wickerhamomyces mucosus]|uniref:SPX domain-containing protein n=1 Tax=Wickerhamomyces mucosus TaxID=1378264 RepID=A0A9P8TDG9_9ASCO|nr:hypothetical protein WICMUC_002757 [Wickerhamomyces mucosus]
MKFGSQLRSKSVPEWRSYNIDYNELKLKIRIATEQNENQNIKNDLFESFIEQINMVNLFLKSKMGEVKRRTIHVEESVEKIEQDPTLIESTEEQLSKLSQDLQKISRFLVIQKTALRKLLKKYTKYSKDNGQLNTKINKYMVQNHNSFIHLDLNGFYLEIALIYDLIREKKSLQVPDNLSISPNQQRVPNSRKRRSSYTNPIANLSKNDSFDFQFIKDGNYSENYLVHYDNLAELKLYLLANFYFIDDSTSSQAKNLQLIREKSCKSLREAIKEYNSPPKKKVDHQDIEEDGTGEEIDSNNQIILSNKDCYRSNSIYLNKSDPLTSSSSTCEILLDDPKQFQSIKNNTDPGVLITNLSDQNQSKSSFLISAIGGLRKCSNVSVSNSDFTTSNLLNGCLNNETFEQFYKKNESVISQLDSLEKISIEWLFSKHIKPILKTKLTKARFSTKNVFDINSHSSTFSDNFNTKFNSYISLTSNIEISESDLSNPEWTSVNKLNSEKFPYAHLTVHYNSQQAFSNTSLNSQFTTLNELLSSHLIYKVDNSFNLLTYSLFKFGKLPFQPAWANLFDNEAVDIRKLPPKTRRFKSKLSYNTDLENTQQQSSISGESSNQFKYWNEFDNGSENEDSNGFLIPINSNGDEGEFQLFNANTIDSFFKISSKISTSLSHYLPLIFDSIDEDNTQALLNSNTQDYGTSHDSDLESLYSNHREKKYQSDKFKLFLALTSSLLSLFLTSVSLGITFSLYSQQDIVVSTTVVVVLITSMLVSLFFATLSLVFLLNTNDLNKNVWQTSFIWITFVGVTGFVILGMVRIFEV